MFTQEELIALRNIIKYASETLSLEDEPLLNWLYDKIDKEIEVYFLTPNSLYSW